MNAFQLATLISAYLPGYAAEEHPTETGAAILRSVDTALPSLFVDYDTITGAAYYDRTVRFQLLGISLDWDGQTIRPYNDGLKTYRASDQKTPAQIAKHLLKNVLPKLIAPHAEQYTWLLAKHKEYAGRQAMHEALSPIVTLEKDRSYFKITGLDNMTAYITSDGNLLVHTSDLDTIKLLAELGQLAPVSVTITDIEKAKAFMAAVA